MIQTTSTVLALLLFGWGSAGQDTDDREVMAAWEQLYVGFLSAWDAKDAGAVASLFSPDGDHGGLTRGALGMERRGLHVGRDAIEAEWSRVFTLIRGAPSKITPRVVRARLVGPNTAIVDAVFEYADRENAENPRPARHEAVMFVLSRVQEEWFVAASRVGGLSLIESE